MKHGNVVRIFDAFETKNFLFIVMEYIGGPSLHRYIKKFPKRRLPEVEAIRLFR